MKKFLCLILLCGATWGQAPTAPIGPAQPMAAIAFLAGDWSAEARPPGSSGPATKILSHYRPILGGRAMTIETSFDGAETYRGLFGYDGEKKAISLWYVTAGGESVRGTVVPQDDYLLIDFTSTKPTGESEHMQTHITKIDADHYQWALFVDPKHTGYVKVFDLVYSRVK